MEIRRAVMTAGAVLAIGAAAYFSVVLPVVTDTGWDTRAVHCLATVPRDSVAGAAEALGYPRPTDIVRWRRDRPAEFDRVCRALFESTRPPTTSTLATLLPFLTGVTGALLAFGAAAWRDRIARGRQSGDALRAAVVEFHDAATAYLTSWTPMRSPEKVLTARGKLTAQLAVIRIEQPRWNGVAALQSMLSDGPLGAAFTEGWTDRAEHDTPQSAELRAHLDRLRDQVLLLAHALTRPLASGRNGGAP